MSGAVYTIAATTSRYVLLVDLDLEGTRSITNDAEDIVRRIAREYPLRRIFYRDTLGRIDEIIHFDGRFVAFAPFLDPRLLSELTKAATAHDKRSGRK